MFVFVMYFLSQVDKGEQEYLELKLNINVLYEDTGHGGKELIIVRDDEKNILSQDFPSKPVISPDKKRLSFIAPREWEKIGKVYMYCIEKDDIDVIIDQDNIPPQFTPKKISWLDNEGLLVIIGYAYGTVSVGGDLYIYDVDSNSLDIALKTEKYREIKNIHVGDTEVILDIAVFDENYLDYEVEKESFTIDEIVGMGR